MTLPEDDRETPTTPLLEAAPGSAPTPILPAGETLAGRYRIVRFIAQGGMGSVYEAEDLDLGERVAVKTLRPEIASDQRALERFHREILLSRKVTHPNVCRIFDLGRHGNVAFLTMEMLRGETLADRLKRPGPMGTEEAFPIVRQIAEALAAAHAAGVVHRDFKPANVILVPAGEDAEGVRAVVTDFGLARGGDLGAGHASSMTETGIAMGTPAYMAPEQVEGGPITPATDVYALGLVLYEMLTGVKPFQGDTPLSSAVKRLRHAPRSPRAHVPDLDRRWEAAVLRCLERDPADRFASAADVLRVLAGGTAPQAPRHRRRRQWRRRAAAAAFGVALATSYWLSRVKPVAAPMATPAASRPTPASPARRSLAVLGFKNLSGRADAAWLSTALSEMLASELAVGERLRMLPGEDVARAKIDLSLAEADALAPDSLGRIRARLGVDYVVLGSFTSLGGGAGALRLDLRIQDVAAGETLAAWAETGTEADLFDLVSRVGGRLRERLGVGGLSAQEAGAVRAALPSIPEAARLYSQGLAKLRIFDALAARELLEKAVALDPKHPLVHSALSAIWSALGYDAKAREEAKRAHDLSEGLPREERLAVEGRYREAMTEWDKAAEVYRTLWGFFPDNLEYGLRLAAVQTFSGKAKDALATLADLRKLAQPSGNDPRIDLAETYADYTLSDFRAQQAAAATAARKAAARGARLLVAEARVREAWALLRLGEPLRAKAACVEAREIFAASGNRAALAYSLGTLANILFALGDLDGSRRMHEEGLAIHRATGNRTGTAFALTELSNVLVVRGDLAEAQRRDEEALAVRRELGGRLALAMVLDNLGEILYNRAALVAARERYEESLATCRAIGDKDVSGDVLNGLGNVLLARGELGEAHRKYEEALALYREIGSRQYVADPLYGLGQVRLAEGDLAGARKQHEEALALREEVGERSGAARSRLALAVVSLEAGQHAEAQARVREALVVFQEQRTPDLEASAQEVLARCHLAQGRVAEAQEALRQAQALASRSQSPYVRLGVAITAARVDAAAGVAARGESGLEAAITAAARAGLEGLNLEARLAKAEIESASGGSTVGRSRLEAVEKQARTRGFLLIARKAAAARR